MSSTRKIMMRGLLAIAWLPMASHAAEYLCPYSLDVALRQGWVMDELESKALREKPELRNVPRDTRVTLIHRLDPDVATSFPEYPATAIDQSDGSVEYVWKLAAPSAENPTYIGCIYAGSARFFARKILPEKALNCSTQRGADGKYSRLLRCD